MGSETRVGNRTPGDLRPLRLTPGFVGSADGSVLFELGSTRVLCTASLTRARPSRASRVVAPWRSSA
jgi:ribonuclease PH